MSEITSFLPLTPATFHILLALADGEKHGYSIMQEVTTLSEGQVKMGPGTLYGSIKRLLANGLITESAQRPTPDDDDERRRYYALSGLGQQVLKAEAQRLESLYHVVRARRILENG